MSDVIIKKTYPGVEYEGTEAGAIYYEDREIAGVTYRTQNAQYNTTSLNWSLSQATLPANAIRENADGSVSFLTMPKESGPWTQWYGAGPSGVFNARDFGASPSASDNSGSINNAIIACNAAGGGIVYLPAGQYATTHQITLMSGVRLKGAAGSVGATSQNPVTSLFGTVIVPSTGYDTIVTSSTTDTPFCGIEDLTIYGGADISHWAMRVYGASAGLIIRNVAIVIGSVNPGFGILIEGFPGATDSSGARLDNVSVTSTYSDPNTKEPVGVGIQLGDVESGKLYTANICTLTGIVVSGFQFGIKHVNGTGHTMMGGSVESCTYGIYSNGDQLLVAGGLFYGNTTAVYLGESSDTSAVIGGRCESGTNALYVQSGATAPRVMQLHGANPIGTGWPTQPPSPATIGINPASFTNNLGTDATVFVTTDNSTTVLIEVGGTHIPDASQVGGWYQVAFNTTSFGIRVPVGQTITLGWDAEGNPPTWIWYGD